MANGPHPTRKPPKSRSSARPAMRKRRMPPPTFVLQRLRGATLKSLAEKYSVPVRHVYEWQWDVCDDELAERMIRPKGLCRALAEQLVRGRRHNYMRGLPWFADGVLNALDEIDDEEGAQRDHAYALLRGGRITMDSHP